MGDTDNDADEIMITRHSQVQGPHLAPTPAGEPKSIYPQPERKHTRKKKKKSL